MNAMKPARPYTGDSPLRTLVPNSDISTQHNYTDAVLAAIETEINRLGKQGYRVVTFGREVSHTGQSIS